MMKVSNYSYGTRLASVAKSAAVLKQMIDMNYDVCYVEPSSLRFYPDGLIVPLVDSEYDAFCNLPDYSILEFREGRAYLSHDAGSLDNAIFITNRCNSNCIMCPTSNHIRAHSEMADISNLLKLCHQIPGDAAHLTITGGEPFLLKDDLFILLEYLKNQKGNIEYLLLSNGRALGDYNYFTRFKATVPSNLLLGIPLHGYDATSHDGITRSPGSFKQTCQGLKYLASTCIKVELRIVVSRLNIDFIDAITDLVIRELAHVHVVTFIGLEMLGNARLNFEEVWVDYRSSFGALTGAIDNLIASGIDVVIYNYPLCCVEEKYWSICHRSISPEKVRHLDECQSCAKKDYCGGMFLGTYKLMEGKLRAIR